MLKIAGIQMSCGNDPEANRRKAVEMASLASERGAKIIGFPQLSVLPWFAYESSKGHFELAETMEGPTVNVFRNVARQHGVVLVFSIFERDGTNFFNTSVVVERNGEVIGRYRKVHLPQIPLWSTVL